MGGWWENSKPAVAMVVMQLIYSGVSISSRTALLQGMSPRVFVVYRQAIATLVIAPIAYFSRVRKERLSLGLRSFSLIFLASLFGVTINQNIYFEGLYLASSSLASAMSNLVPGITIIIAASVGLEKMDIKSLRSMAKVGGTILCVAGGVSIAMLDIPKFLNMELPNSISILQSSRGEHWILGCLLLFGSCCCWSFWLILQVPMSASYPHRLGLSAWMCFFATIQSGIFALLSEPDSTAWILQSKYELFCCLFAGVVGSAVSFFVQGWCVSKRGPLFCAMYNPLSTVIVTGLACMFLHEGLYIESFLGALAVVGGLYVVLWVKAKEQQDIRTDPSITGSCDHTVKATETCDACYNTDIEKPLLD